MTDPLTNAAIRWEIREEQFRALIVAIMTAADQIVTATNNAVASGHDLASPQQIAQAAEKIIQDAKGAAAGPGDTPQ